MVSLYCDTCIWDALLKLELKSGELEETPVDSLVISRHVIYELGLTFERNPEAGRSFFRTLTRLFDSGVRIANEPFNLLIEEMNHLNDGRSIDYEFYNRRDFRAELVNLSEVITANFVEFSRSRSEAARSDKERIASALTVDEHVRLQLLAVDRNDLEQWIDDELKSHFSRSRLLEKLQTIFPEVPKTELLEWATALTPTRGLRIIQALLRLDIYYNWRSVRTSNFIAARDLLPDSYHIINALYCSGYATAEASQAKYASLLGMPSAKIHCWDRSVRIDRWLKDVVEKLKA